MAFDRSLSILDYYVIFSRNKINIFLWTLSISIITAFIVFFIIDPIYYSSSIIKSSSTSSGLGSLMSNSGIPDFSDLSDISLGGSGGKELALYENILNSRRAIEPAIYKFNILEKENIKYMEDAIKYFRKSVMEVSKDKIAGTIEIGINDKDPAIAKEICSFMIEQLNKINIELNVLNAKNNREFIENRYNSAKNELTQSEDSLKYYQNRFGISPDIQTKASMQMNIELESQIKSEEIKLSILSKILSPEQNEIKIQKEKISALKEQIEKLKSNDYENMLSLKNAPTKVLDYLRLLRNVEISNKIVMYLLPLYEQAKIEEKKQMPTVLVIDYPQIPDKKVKPKRLIIILIFTLIGFIISYSFYFIKSNYNSKKVD